MSMIIRISILLILLSLCSNSFSESDAIYDRKIFKIATYDSFAIIYYSPNLTTTQGCSTGYNNSGVIRFDSEKGQSLLSAVLTAATTQSNKVGFGINGCDATGRPSIYRIETNY